MTEDDEGRIFIGTTAGLNIIDSDLNLTKVDDPRIENAFIPDLSFGEDGKVYGSTNSGDGFVIEGCLDPFSNPHYSNNSLSAAISGKFAARLNVRNCEIRNCRGGGVYMLKADHSTIENCHIHHVGGQGVYFVDGGAGFCKVLGNHIHNAAGGAYVEIART
jgi:hypothetical protein